MIAGWLAGCTWWSGATPAPEPDLWDRVRTDAGEDAPDDEPDDREPRRRPVGRFEPVADPCAGFGQGGLFTYTTTFDGQTSEALLSVPPGPGPFDLVVVLHGGSGTPAKMLGQTHFDDPAEAPGVVVLAPTSAEIPGHGNHWNSGNHREAEEIGRDDVAYLDALTAEVREQVCARRVLAAGFSNGGQMVNRWGCQGTQPDAVLSAAGRLVVPSGTCKPRPIRGYVGTEDPVFDEAPHDGPDQVSAVETFDKWAEINGCEGAPVERRDRDAVCRVASGCEAPTELCVIEGLHHAWPGPWNRRKPTQISATADGLGWFREVVPERRGDERERAPERDRDGRDREGERDRDDGRREDGRREDGGGGGGGRGGDGGGGDREDGGRRGGGGAPAPAPARPGPGRERRSR